MKFHNLISGFKSQIYKIRIALKGMKAWYNVVLSDTMITLMDLFVLVKQHKKYYKNCDLYLSNKKKKITNRFAHLFYCNMEDVYDIKKGSMLI